MWNKTHYRQDKYWNAHSIYRPFLMRYQHFGRFPINTLSLPRATSEFRVKHIYGIREQYNSIMDANPNLIKWKVG